MKKVLGVTGASIAALGSAVLFKNNKVPQNLGLKSGRLLEIPNMPGALASKTSFKGKEVKALKFKGDLEQSKSAILKTISQLSNGKILVSSKNYIHVVFSSSRIKCKDDVEFYFDEQNEIIEFRSVPRIPVLDLGYALDRYKRIRNIYELYIITPSKEFSI